jgi:UDP-N-acetylmuramoylalanine--D-glutamate ligase
VTGGREAGEGEKDLKVPKVLKDLKGIKDPKDLAVLVCGAGKSGEAAARVALAEGRRVVVADTRSAEALGEARLAALKALEAAGAEVALGAAEAPEGEWGEAVVSPGLDVNGAFLKGLAARGIPLVSEIEWGWRRWRGKTALVTGSNGKSSVVKALAELLGGVACGNYGVPVCEAVASDKPWLVVEASSFQLEAVRGMRADVAICLNLLPNHLDRHGDMETYGRLKARVFAAQGEDGLALVPPELLDKMREWSGGRGHWETFGGADDAADWRWTPEGVVGPRVEGALAFGGYFANPVLGPAAAAVAAAATWSGAEPTAVARGLDAFGALPHRNALVAERGGVRWVDDSKATNLASLVAGVRMQPGRVRLIAGGRPKESDWSAARGVLKEKASGVYLIGEAAESMRAAWADAVPCEVCGTLERAVDAARAAAQRGETVLLAPGCTSFDQFASYGERGERFAALARG